ncbi:hypothetical protein [Akkermansia muciniphila]|nr:hypothetical protein [Akkermansia muciniphila]
MATTVESITVPFIKMKEKKNKPEPGYFIHEDEAGKPIETDPVLIPIKQNVNDRNETWKGYIKVDKPGTHYFRIDGDDVLTLKIPHAKVDITTGGGSLTTQTAQSELERGFYYCELTYNNKAYTPEAKSYEGCIAIMSTTEMPPAGKYVQYDTTKSELASGTPMKLLKLGKGCRIDWPTKPVALGTPIEWYETSRQFDTAQNKYVTCKKANGKIESLTAQEVNQVARVIYAEGKAHDKADYSAVASVFMNRWGHGRNPARANHSAVKTVAESLDPTQFDGLKRPKYLNTEGKKYEELIKAECECLDEALEALLAVLAGGPTVDYDAFRTKSSAHDPKEWVTIGANDYKIAHDFSSCSKPEGWEEMPKESDVH